MSRVSEVKDGAENRFAALRRRFGLLDHAVRMQQHAGKVNVSQQAGAITYFGFLSFFPILALAFFVIGYVVKVYPEAQDNLTSGIGEVLPGLIGNGSEQISLRSIQNAAGAVGIIGVLGVLYAGLGWLSSVRNALTVVFELEDEEQPNFVVGKLRDLVTLATIGVVLIASVAVSSVVAASADWLLDLVGLGSELSPLLRLVSIALGLAASAVLFFAIFRLLANPDLSAKALWGGAALGAVGFEALKQLSAFLLASTKNQPAFQAFGIALILVVWINYFSKLVLYAASWAAVADPAPATQADPRAAAIARAQAASASQRPEPSAVGAVGAGAAAALLALIVRDRRRARA